MRRVLSSRFVRKPSPIVFYYEVRDGGPLAPNGPLLAKSPDFSSKGILVSLTDGYSGKERRLAEVELSCYSDIAERRGIDGGWRRGRRR